MDKEEKMDIHEVTIILQMQHWDSAILCMFLVTEASLPLLFSKFPSWDDFL